MSEDATNGRRGPEEATATKSAIRPRAWMAANGSALTKGSDSACTRYVRPLLFHRANLAFFGMAVVVGMLSGAWWVILGAVAVESVVLGGIPRIPAYRRWIEDHNRKLEQAEAAEARETVLRRLQPHHREGLEELEMLVVRIQQNAQARGCHLAAILEERRRLEKLLLCYIRLSLRHKHVANALAMTDRAALDAEMEHLAQRPASTERLEELTRRRLSVLKRRAQAWDRGRAALDAITSQLSMIRDLVHLVHQQSVAPMESGGETEDIDQFMYDLEEHEDMLRELRELDVDEDKLQIPRKELDEAEDVPLDTRAALAS